MKWDKLFYYKMVIFRGVFYSGVALGTAWVTATQSIRLSELQWDSWINLVIGVLVAWGTTMLSFFDQTLAKANVDDGAKVEPPKPQ